MNIINRILKPFDLYLTKLSYIYTPDERTKQVMDLEKHIDSLESDKLALQDKMLELDRLNCTPRCDGPYEQMLKDQQAVIKEQGKKIAALRVKVSYWRKAARVRREAA